MQVNEEKRKKFMEYAGKRVNNVLHDIQILEPMSRSNSYDFTRQDVDEMFYAMQETLNNAKAEFEKKFEEKARSEKKTFSFGTSTNTIESSNITSNTIDNTTLNTSTNTAPNDSPVSFEHDIEESISTIPSTDDAIEADTTSTESDAF